MSASIQTEWPCQQSLHICEIKETPPTLIKFPLQITGLRYESPSTWPDTEVVETEAHLEWLAEEYELFLARKRLARLFYPLTPTKPREPCVDDSSSLPMLARRGDYDYYVAPGMPRASDGWLVPKPYSPLVDTHTEPWPVSPTPTRLTPTTPGTPGQSSIQPGTRVDYTVTCRPYAGRRG